MLRAESQYRTIGVLFLISALATGCGGTGGADTSHLDASGSDTKPLDPDATLPDTTAVYAIDTDESQEAGVSNGEVGTAIPPGDAGGEAGNPPQTMATIVVLPDTQYYSASYPDVFTGQTDWIIEHKPANDLNIAAVLHVGDIVDSDQTIQWTVGNPAMRELDKVVPYVVVPGNHDYSTIDRGTMMENYFAPSSMPWITGTMTPDKIDNNYTLMDIGPQKWLILGLEFAPRDAVLAWANTILKTYAQYPAILLTHLYLYGDGTRYDIAVGGNDQNASNYQWWNPQYYGFTASEGINDGEAMWQKLVLPNSNVRLVFCGHATGWQRMTSTRPDGTTVHQMLSDYQWLNGRNFGYGYLRVVQLDYGSKKIRVQTFSPYLNAFLTDDPNQFTVDLNL